jgi:hypothetical protein
MAISVLPLPVGAVEDLLPVPGAHAGAQRVDGLHLVGP